MNTQNVILKGMLIFGVLGFALFLVLIVLGIIMSAVGLTCHCFSIFAWSLMGIAVVSGFVSWYGCCNRNQTE